MTNGAADARRAPRSEVSTANTRPWVPSGTASAAVVPAAMTLSAPLKRALSSRRTIAPASSAPPSNVRLTGFAASSLLAASTARIPHDVTVPAMRRSATTARLKSPIFTSASTNACSSPASSSAPARRAVTSSSPERRSSASDSKACAGTGTTRKLAPSTIGMVESYGIAFAVCSSVSSTRSRYGPIATVAICGSGTHVSIGTARPSNSVPNCPQLRISQPPSRSRSSACRRDTERSGSTTSHAASRPITRTVPSAVNETGFSQRPSNRRMIERPITPAPEASWRVAF